MARQPRFFVPGEVLHVIQRGNNREPIFAREKDYRLYLNCLVQASRLHGVPYRTKSLNQSTDPEVHFVTDAKACMRPYYNSGAWAVTRSRMIRRRKLLPLHR
jgi:REP element-mobilizing transposase RayT